MYFMNTFLYTFLLKIEHTEEWQGGVYLEIHVQVRKLLSCTFYTKSNLNQVKFTSMISNRFQPHNFNSSHSKTSLKNILLHL